MKQIQEIEYDLRSPDIFGCRGFLFLSLISALAGLCQQVLRLQPLQTSLPQLLSAEQKIWYDERGRDSPERERSRQLAAFDLTSASSGRIWLFAAYVLFGLFCFSAMVSARMFADLFAPGAGPFALIYPAVVVATLYGRWQAGLTAYILGFAWTWCWLLPPGGSFMFQEAGDRSRMIVNSISAALVMILAEVFRRAVVHDTRERDMELSKRMLIHEEFEHRTKNNFTLVISLLRLQRTRANDDLSLLLDQTITRIMCISEVYASISLDDQRGSNISIRPYLTKLAERIASAAFGPDVEVTIAVADVSFSREIAGAIGLFANEALTNCAKYAFPDGHAGNVRVDLKVDGLIWTLIVQGDGMGRNTPAVQSIPGAGSGSRIMKAFAQQAGASHSLRITDKGCVAQLTGKLA